MASRRSRSPLASSRGTRRRSGSSESATNNTTNRSRERLQNFQHKGPGTSPFLNTSRRSETRILVEQIHEDKGEARDVSDPGEGNSSTAGALTVPEPDIDESSEASSVQSQHSDDGHSGATNTEDDSIALDCHTNPSEVIVKGKNVKQIRVKFPPHPPSTSEEGPRKKSARPRYHRTSSKDDGRSHSQNKASSSSRASRSTDRVQEEEKLPYPCEETALPAITGSSENPRADSLTALTLLTGRGSGPAFPSSIQRQESSYISLHSNDVSADVSLSAVAPGSARPPPTNTVNWPHKFRQDVLAGLDFFERRSTDLQEVSTRLQHELELLRVKNAELEKLVERLDGEKRAYSDSLDEMRSRLDASEKENARLSDQAVTQWQDRVQLEESYVALQRDSQSEIHTLKRKLDEKDAELQQAQSRTKALRSSENIVRPTVHNLSPLPPLDMVDSAKSPPAVSQKTSSNKALADDKLELVHTISRLQETIDKLSREKDSGLEANNRLRQEMSDTKAQLKEKTQELESQYKRFLSLKKSFNDKTEEVEKLKSQLRARGVSHGASHVILQSREHHHQHQQQHGANTTWPAASGGPVGGVLAPRKNSLNTVDMENVSYINLGQPTNGNPRVVAAGTTGQGAQTSYKQHATTGGGKGAAKSHKPRNKADQTGPNQGDNLPPVPKPSR